MNSLVFSEIVYYLKNDYAKNTCYECAQYFSVNIFSD